MTSPDDDCVVKTCALVAAGHYEVQGMEARLLSRQLQPQQLLGLKEKKRLNVERVEDLNSKKYLNRLAPVSRRPGRFVALDQGLWIAEKRKCI